MNKNSMQGKRLPQQAITAWRVEGGLWSLLGWLLPVFFGFGYFFRSVPLWYFMAALGGAVSVTVLLTAVAPRIRWRQWKYSLSEHEIDLHHGIWFRHRTLVPVKRVQHVDTRQGPLLRRYQLADVVISTAATTHRIPALTESTANQVRADISSFARQARDDV